MALCVFQKLTILQVIRAFLCLYGNRKFFAMKNATVGPITNQSDLPHSFMLCFYVIFSTYLLSSTEVFWNLNSKARSKCRWDSWNGTQNLHGKAWKWIRTKKQFNNNETFGLRKIRFPSGPNIEKQIPQTSVDWSMKTKDDFLWE
jgi:hypothetical protein